MLAPKLTFVLLVSLLAASEATKCYFCFNHGPEKDVSACKETTDCPGNCQITVVNELDRKLRLLEQGCAPSNNEPPRYPQFPPQGLVSGSCDVNSATERFKQLYPSSSFRISATCKSCSSDLCNNSTWSAKLSGLVLMISVIALLAVRF